MSEKLSILSTPTRDAGFARMHAFLDHMGKAYAANRNFDFGPDDRSNISCLSGHVRHRLVLECELADAALKAHGPIHSQVFIQEVFWRTYWKGWLEMRPRVWDAYKAQRDADMAAADRNERLRETYRAAIAGETGIACFDAWARELLAYGYLHNHARMWFASIWIFTLKLPWALGADHFLRHLIDGDAASNTLSWRWVAGLQTQGKAYGARASNIERFTNGRFTPQADAFARDVEALEWRDPPSPNLPALTTSWPSQPYTLFLHEEDCAPETLTLSKQPQRVLVQAAPAPRGQDALGQRAQSFTQGALDDLLTRALNTFDVPVERISLDEVRGLQGAVSMPYVPVGPLRDALGQHGMEEVVRAEDGTLWPFATKGFFKFKKAIPDAVAQLGLGLG